MAFSIVSLAANIPKFTFKTQSGVDVTEKTYYAMDYTLEDVDHPEYNQTAANANDSIKVRGNSTAFASKKPYRIKLNKKTPLFGLPEAKSWVLLANYYDNSQMLNAIAFELGKRFGLDYTPDYRFVNVYINDVYKGIYLLCDQIQVGNNRVNISKKEGFLVEFDYHDAEADEIKFQWKWNGVNNEMDSLGTFLKSPEFDDPANADIQWVKDDLDKLSSKMFAADFPENGYRDLIDLESVAKYIMIEKFLDNFDFNSQAQVGFLPGSNYFYKDVDTKIFAGPLWDFDLAAGVSFTFTPTYYTTTGDDNHHNMIPTHSFYKRFFDDPVFLAKWKKIWDAHQADINSLGTFIDSIAEFLKPSIVENFNVLSSSGSFGGGFGGFGGFGSTYPTSIESYISDCVTPLKNWITGRQEFFNKKIEALNIDITKDIVPISFSISKYEMNNLTKDLPVYYSLDGKRLGLVKPVNSGVYLVKKGLSFERFVVGRR